MTTQSFRTAWVQNKTKKKITKVLKLLQHHVDFSLWIKFQANNGASCQQAIMVLSDGTTSSLSDLFEEQNPDKKVSCTKLFYGMLITLSSAPREMVSYIVI